MDQPTPEEPQPPAAVPDRDNREERVEARLRTLVDYERIVAWTRGWVSRELPLHTLIAARTLDFAVLTEHSLFLITSGFFTRRPRRVVFASPLTDLFVSRVVVPGGRRLRITSAETHTLWIEMRATDRARTFAAAVVARARAEQP